MVDGSYRQHHSMQQELQRVDRGDKLPSLGILRSKRRIVVHDLLPISYAVQLD